MERINRYRDTASMRKPTGQQLSEGAFFSRRGAGGRDGWNAPRTGRKAADIPKFRNGTRTRDKQPVYRRTLNARETNLIRQFYSENAK